MSTCYLSQVPGASHENLVLPTSTCCLPLPPQFRNLFEEILRDTLPWAALPHLNPSRLSTPYIRTAIRLNGGAHICSGGVYTFHTPGNKVLQRTLYEKKNPRGRSK